MFHKIESLHVSDSFIYLVLNLDLKSSGAKSRCNALETKVSIHPIPPSLKYSTARTKEKHWSRPFTEVKPCWMGLITGWVTTWGSFLAVLLGESGWALTTPSTLTANAACVLSFDGSQPDFEGFLWILRFPLITTDSCQCLMFISGVTVTCHKNKNK